MRNFKRDYNQKGRGEGNQDRNRYFGGRDDRSRPQLFKTTCDECGRSCEVPFKPTGSKPIYCDSCFRGGDDRPRKFDRDDRKSSRDQGRDRGRGRSRDNSFGCSGRDDREMFEAVCDSCGKTCEVPFKPSGEKAVFCDSCFGASRPLGGDNKKSRGTSPSDDKLDMINAKLDKILNILQPPVPLKILREQKFSQEKAETEKETAAALAETNLSEAEMAAEEADTTIVPAKKKATKAPKPKKLATKKKTAAKKAATKKPAKAPAKKKAASKTATKKTATKSKAA